MGSLRKRVAFFLDGASNDNISDGNEDCKLFKLLQTSECGEDNG